MAAGPELSSAPNRRAPARPWVVTGLLVLLAAAAVILWPRQPAGPALPEVTRTELVERDGHLYRSGEAQPFTGWLVERYPDGQYRSRSRLADGVLSGVSEGWHPDGTLQIREHYQAGVCEGLRTRWHTNGVVMSQTTFVAGRPEGVFRRWHPNGVLAEQIEFRDGKEHGTSLALYPSGHLRASARVAEGELVENDFWPDGAREAAPGLASATPLKP